MPCRVCAKKECPSQGIRTTDLDIIGCFELAEATNRPVPQVGSKDLLSADWIEATERKPDGIWSKNFPELSEEVFVANSCSISIAYYDRTDGVWYCGEPADAEWIDKITHWMPLPKNPHLGI